MTPEKQQTAVDRLKEKVKETYDKEGKLPLGYVLNLIAQAKAMEAEQIVVAFMEGDGSDCTQEEDPRLYAEQYYNETYKK